MLDRLVSRANSNTQNASEFFRVLLHREYNRCHTGKSHVPQSVWSEMRIGRPKKGTTPNV